MLVSNAGFGRSASKGGLVALTHALGASLGPDRIRVNCICPGWIESDATSPAPATALTSGDGSSMMSAWCIV